MQNKVLGIINAAPLRDTITPHYVNLGLLKFRDIVKLYTWLFMYKHICENKPCNFSKPLVSEQQNYSIRSASTQKLFVPHFRINLRKFCATVVGKKLHLSVSAGSISSKPLFEKAVYKYCFAQC